MIKEVLMLFLLFSLGYLVYSLIYELIDRFIYKVKRISISIAADDFKQLKSYVKKHGNGMNVEKYLQFHFKEDIKELLESE